MYKIILTVAIIALCGCSGATIQSSADQSVSADRGRHRVDPPPVPGYTTTVEITNNRPRHIRHGRNEVCPFTIMGTSGTLAHDVDPPPTIIIKTDKLDPNCTWSK